MNLTDRRRAATVIVLAAILFAALLGGLGIAQHPFWDDEAETALLARSIVQGHGRSGWTDGNVAAFRGGINLNDHLVQSDVSPLQYYVTAGSFRLFGASTLAGRVPFFLAGLATIWILYCWSYDFLGHGRLSWLPPWIIATQVSFSLFIAQCRYYALTIVFSAIALWGWSRCVRQPRLATAIGAVATLCLFESNYLDAIALTGAIAVGSLFDQGRKRAVFLPVIGCVVGFGLIAVLSGNDTVAVWKARLGETPPLERFAILFWRQMTGLGSFEFFPILSLPFLSLPWLSPKASAYRPLVKRAAIAIAMGVTYIGIVAAISPQNPRITLFADMRYDLPLMLFGSVVTTVAIATAAASVRPVIAAFVAAMLMLTTIGYSGQAPGLVPIADRLHEIVDRHPSAVQAWLDAVRPLSPGTSVRITPRYMSLPLMFYRPDLRYYGMLDADKPIVPGIKAQLPGWVFCCQAQPSVLIAGIGDFAQQSAPLEQRPDYPIARIVPYAWLDKTRPELPLHAFYGNAAADRNHGIAVMIRQSAPIEP